MICPHCLKKVSDDSVTCPHCGAYLGVEPVAHSEFVYCEGCGARLSSRDRTCPKCGRPAPGILSTEASASDLAAGKTASFPKVTNVSVPSPDAALPSAADVLEGSFDADATTVFSVPTEGAQEPASDAGEDPYHKKKRPWAAIAAVLAGIALVGGGIYLVAADPFDLMPGVYRAVDEAAADMFPSRPGMGGSAAEEPAAGEGDAEATDTGAQDEPQQIEDDAILTDDEAFTQLLDIWEAIGAYQDPLGEVITQYNGGYLLSSLAARQAASEAAYDLRDQVQATIDQVEDLALAHDSAYTEDREHLVSLATWMYNRVDVLCTSWDISLSYPDGESMSSHESEILQPLRDALDATGQNENLVLFEQNYSSWRPVQKS